MIQKILLIDSGKQWPSTTRCPSPDASRSQPPAAGSASPAISFEGRRVMCRGNTVGAAEAGSRCLMHRSFGYCKLPAQPVSHWPLHRALASSTLLRGGGGQCQRVTPLRQARGRRDCGYVFLCQTKLYHAIPETMALCQLNYGCTIL